MWKLEFGQMVDVPYSLVNSVRVAEPIENFCFFMFKNQLHIVAANGPYLSLVRVDEDGLKLLSTVHAFQKPVMKVVYDQQRQRLIAAGLDQQVKFFEIFEEETPGELQLRLQYKIKLPKAVFQFGIAADGQHFSVGLADGSLIIKSKQLEEFKEEQDDEMKMILDNFQSSFKSKAKNYKYFYRG